jgi:hypothetical protein
LSFWFSSFLFGWLQRGFRPSRYLTNSTTHTQKQQQPPPTSQLGDALEAQRKWRDALRAYQEALSYAPNNKVAMQRSTYCAERAERLGL